MSGLARAVTWTQRVGYSYPSEIFEPALKAANPDLTRLEVEHCVSEWERENLAWNQRVEAMQVFDVTP